LRRKIVRLVGSLFRRKREREKEKEREVRRKESFFLVETKKQKLLRYKKESG